MTRKGFVGLAGAVVVAAFFCQAIVTAQSKAAPKAPAKSDQSAPAKAQTPAAPKSNPDTKPPQKSEASGGAVPATTPTQQPTQGPAEEPKVSANTIGSVTIPKKVMADGKPLAAGTYTLRLTDQMGSPVTGQTPSEERWVEFLQGGQVKGRELATVLTNTEAKTIAKQGVHSGAKIQTLIGNEYLRVWINKGGTNYLVHLPNS